MPAQFVPFRLERLLSAWENRVEYNLSESGVHPLSAREVLDNEAALDTLAGLPLRYPQANGMAALRDAVAALYSGATAENVLVTVGAIQANLVALAALTQPGDAVAVLEPNYRQLWGAAQNLGRRVATFGLRPELEWRLDRDELEDAITPATRLVAIVNPNNPTGRVLSADDRRAVVEAARSAGAWLLADEVYAGAERTSDTMTPTFYGEYERVLAVNSLSKTYALPGLRIGWIVGPVEAIARMWAWQDYVTISAGMLGNQLATRALSPRERARIIARTRDYVRHGFARLAAWASQRDDVEIAPHDAGGICLIKYRQPIGSSDLAMRLIERASTLVAPGDAFGPDGYLRIGFALPGDYLDAGLQRIGAVLDDLQPCG
jgi:aspartate/methionine/tyrosine aminotransferase